MRKLLIKTTIISSILLAGCSAENRISLKDIDVLPDVSMPGVYRIPIQQGNLITQEMINELKPGMTRRQVRFLLGTPLLVDTFHENRWDYLYSNRPGSTSASTEIEQKRLRLDFKNGRLHKILGDMYPQGEALAKATKAESRERTIVVPADAPRYNEETGLFESLLKKVIGSDEPVAQTTRPKKSTSNNEQTEEKSNP